MAIRDFVPSQRRLFFRLLFALRSPWPSDTRLLCVSWKTSLRCVLLNMNWSGHAQLGEGRARKPLAPGSEARLPTVWLNWRHVNSYPPFLFVTDARHSVCIDGCRRCAKDDIRMTRPTHEQRRHSDRRLCVLWPGKSQMHQLLPGIKRRNALGSQTSICTWTLASELGCKYMLGNRRGSDP